MVRCSYGLLPLLLLLTGCTLVSVGSQEEIASVATIQALTPTRTWTPERETTPLPPTPTPLPTLTASPLPTASATPLPTVTPVAPTATPNPALVDFSFCDQRAGALDGTFSARLDEATISGNASYEQLRLRFTLSNGSGPLGATATCLQAPEPPELLVTGTYLLRISLPGWLLDEQFQAANLPPTITFSGTRSLQALRIVPAIDADRGVDLLIELNEPRPFRLSIERNPTRLFLAVAHQSPLSVASHPLGLPAGDAQPTLDAPIFTLFDGDLWRIEAGSGGIQAGLRAERVRMLNLSASPESETDLAVSADRSQVAFCRSLPGLDPTEEDPDTPGALWVMGSRGEQPRMVAQIGVSCADPAFSLDGTTLAFAVDETGMPPTQRVIYTVPVAGGVPQRLGSGFDEWSRSAPQWLAGGALIYSAQAPDGRSTIFLRRTAEGVEEDLAGVAVPPSADAEPYTAFARPLAARDGRYFAVEALRSERNGADLLIFDDQGLLVDRLGSQRIRTSSPPPQPTPTQRVAPNQINEATPATPRPTAELALPAEPRREGPFWSRGLAWNSAGQLLYLSTNCTSPTIQEYQLYRWNGIQRSELLASGQSLGGIGAATMVGSGLIYQLTSAPADPYGSRASRTPTELWLWDLATGARNRLLSAERGIGALQP